MLKISFGKKINSSSFYYLLHILFTVSIVVYGLCLIPAMLYYFNTDSLAYVSVAKQYAIGNFSDAVSSHWSPAFSWLLVPFVWMNINLIFAGKVILVLTVLSIIWLTRKIFIQLRINEMISLFGCITIAVISLHPALFNFTPDVLLIPFILFFILQILKEAENPLSTNWIHFAIAGAVGFYVKQYVFFVFPVLLMIFRTMQFAYYPEINREIFWKSFRTLSFFILLILPWVLIISIKERKFCISTASDYNISLLGQPEQPVNTYLQHGLIDLPFKNAFSYWDNPSKLKYQRASITAEFKDKAHLKYLYKNLIDNYNVFFDFTDFILGYHLLLILLPALIFGIYFMLKQDVNSKNYLILFIVLFIYSIGYIFLVSDYRYIYFDIILIVIIAVKLLNDAVSPKLPPIIYVLSGLCFFYVFGKKSVDKIDDFYKEGINQNSWIKSVSEKIDDNSRICNYNNEDMNSQLIFKNNLKYFGTLYSSQSLSFQLSELKKMNINFVYSTNPISDSISNYLQPVIVNNNGIWFYKFNN